MKNTKRLINKQYYTVGEVAYILGVTPLTIRNWDRRGKLRAYRNPANNYRIYKTLDIEKFLRSIEGLNNTSDII